MIAATDQSARPAQAEAVPTPSGLEGRRICIVIAALGAGGAERVIAWLASQLEPAGTEVTIISFDSPDDPIYHDFGGNVRLLRLDIAARPKERKLLPPVTRRILALRSALREISPDVAIGFLTKINTILLAATIGMKLPVLVAERNNPQLQPAHPVWKHSLQRLYRRASGIICQTKASMVCIPEDCHDRVTVIPNPVSAPFARSASIREGEQRKISSVGRLERQKGFDILIEAFARIAGDAPGWDLDIWGEGPEQASLAALAEKLGVAGRVHLRGLSSRPGGWIEETDLFVLASRFEGFPNVLGEAMAAGMPVISADCDFGPAELVRNEETGLLVPVEDAGALADALRRMIGDDALRARMAAAAPEVAVTYSSERVADAWRGAIRAAIPN